MANELMLPPYLYPSEVELEMADTVGQFNPMFGYATSQRVDYGATRWKGTLKFTKMTTSERHDLLAFINRVGRSSAFCTPVYGEAQRGSGAFPELFANPTFNGTTSWTTQQSTITAAGRKMRMAVAKNIASGSPGFAQTPSVTQYYPHILRSVIGDRTKTGAATGTYFDGITNYSTDARGFVSQSRVNLGTTAVGYPIVYDDNENVTMTGDWIECLFASMSRCGQVDNGANYLLQSDDFTTTWVNTRTTDTGNNATDPLGTVTGDNIVEDASASTTHYIDQAATVASTGLDLAFTVALKANARTFAQIAMIESTGPHSCVVDCNLSTGAMGTPAVNGANWTNPRSFATDLGDGWWAFTIIGRKASASTSVTCRIYLATGLGTISYTGDGTSSIRAWRGTMANSGVPTRLAFTTTTNDTDGVLQVGSLIHTRGWASSTNELLAAGDFVNIITPNGFHTARLTSPLNTNASGLGTLAFAPSLAESPVDGAAVIPCRPLLKCVAVSAPRVRTYPPGYISDVEIDIEGVF